MKRNQPINPNIVHDILDAIATIFVFFMLGALAVVFLADNLESLIIFLISSKIKI